jgi:hypothetical protein
MTQAETPDVEFHFELQLSDIHRGLAALPRARFSKWVGWFGVVAVLAIIGWRWQEGRDQRTLLVVGALLIAFFVVGRDPTKRIARKIFQQLPADARQVAIRVDETGVQVVSGDTQHLEWAKVTRVTDTRETFLVFASRTNAQILPKRAMTTEQIRTVRELIARHVVPQREPWLTPTLTRRVLIYTVIFAAIWLWYTYRQHH